jgi:hypothetical protein
LTIPAISRGQSSRIDNAADEGTRFQIGTTPPITTNPTGDSEKTRLDGNPFKRKAPPGAIPFGDQDFFTHLLIRNIRKGEFERFKGCLKIFLEGSDAKMINRQFEGSHRGYFRSMHGDGEYDTLYGFARNANQPEMMGILKAYGAHPR